MDIATTATAATATTATAATAAACATTAVYNTKCPKKGRTVYFDGDGNP